jgi:hypothetical protein
MSTSDNNTHGSDHSHAAPARESRPSRGGKGARSSKTFALLVAHATESACAYSSKSADPRPGVRPSAAVPQSTLRFLANGSARYGAAVADSGCHTALHPATAEPRADPHLYSS